MLAARVVEYKDADTKVAVVLSEELRIPGNPVPVLTLGKRLELSVASIRQPMAGSSPTPAEIDAGVEGGGVHRGQSVDARDKYFTWNKATVLDTDASRNSVLIHYRGFGPEWDSWMPCDSVHLAPMRQYTTWRPEKVGFPVAPEVGTIVMLRTAPSVPRPGPEANLLECIVTRMEGEADTTKVWVRETSKPAEDEGHQVILGNMRLREKAPHVLWSAPSADVLGEADGTDLRQGQSVDVRDDGYSWYTASIQKVHTAAGAGNDSDGNLAITIRYDGWGNLWTERISLPSPRVMPLHTHTPAGFRSA